MWRWTERSSGSSSAGQIKNVVIMMDQRRWGLESQLVGDRLGIVQDLIHKSVSLFGNLTCKSSQIMEYNNDLLPLAVCSHSTWLVKKSFVKALSTVTTLSTSLNVSCKLHSFRYTLTLPRKKTKRWLKGVRLGLDFYLGRMFDLFSSWFLLKIKFNQGYFFLALLDA